MTEKEKKEVMDLLYKYKEAFSLRDEIGTWPNIGVGIDVTEKSPFFIWSYHVREEDKKVIDKEMKCLCYLGILKEGFLPYSSLVMLISRKLTQDKRVVTDFRHLNVRIVKNNSAHPLVRDTFSVLGNSKCEVLSVLDLKDIFHLLRLSENSKRCYSVLPYFRSASYMYQRMPLGLNISPSIWQSYINVTIDCLQSRKHCEAIMDDLLLFTPPKKCQLFKTESQYMGNVIFIQDKKVCVKLLRSRIEANLPFLSKLLEKCAMDRFNKHCGLNNLLLDYQSAYRKWHLCETSLLKLVNDNLWAMESQCICPMMAIDNSAAFNTVDHSILLAVLEHNFGLTGAVLDGYDSYLCPRSCKAKIKESYSTVRSLQFSVPQGSCAGAQLHNAYCSTMHEVVQKPILLYGFADDHTLRDQFKAKWQRWWNSQHKQVRK